ISVQGVRQRAPAMVTFAQAPWHRKSKHRSRLWRDETSSMLSWLPPEVANPTSFLLFPTYKPLCRATATLRHGNGRACNARNFGRPSAGLPVHGHVPCQRSSENIGCTKPLRGRKFVIAIAPPPQRQQRL